VIAWPSIETVFAAFLSLQFMSLPFINILQAFGWYLQAWLNLQHFLTCLSSYIMELMALHWEVIASMSCLIARWHFHCKDVSVGFLSSAAVQFLSNLVSDLTIKEFKLCDRLIFAFKILQEGPLLLIIYYIRVTGYMS